MKITISMGVVLEGRVLLLSKNNFAEFYFFHNYCESLLFILFKSINTYVFNCIKVNFCTVRHLTDPPWPRASGTGEGGGLVGRTPPPLPMQKREQKHELLKVPPPLWTFRRPFTQSVCREKPSFCQSRLAIRNSKKKSQPRNWFEKQGTSDGTE